MITGPCRKCGRTLTVLNEDDLLCVREGMACQQNLSPLFAVAASVMVLCLLVAGTVWSYRQERSPAGREELFVLQCGDSMSGVDLRELKRSGRIRCVDKYDKFMEAYGDGRFVVCKAQTDIGEVGYVCDSTGCSWSIRNGVEP